MEPRARARERLEERCEPQWAGVMQVLPVILYLLMTSSRWGCFWGMMRTSNSPLKSLLVLMTWWQSLFSPSTNNVNRTAGGKKTAFAMWLSTHISIEDGNTWVVSVMCFFFFYMSILAGLYTLLFRYSTFLEFVFTVVWSIALQSSVFEMFLK